MTDGAERAMRGQKLENALGHRMVTLMTRIFMLAQVEGWTEQQTVVAVGYAWGEMSEMYQTFLEEWNG